MFYKSTATDSIDTIQAIETWIPITLALVTPLFFASSNIQTKYLTTKLNFDASRLSFGSFILVGVILTGILIPQMFLPGFVFKYLIVGTIGSISNVIGLVFMAKACSTGPIGPAMALSNMNTIIFSIVEAIKQQKMPRGLEIAGLLIGFTGALVISIPEYMENLFRIFTCRKPIKH